MTKKKIPAGKKGKGIRKLKKVSTTSCKTNGLQERDEG
jgi:hypothetical protein